MAGVLLMDGCDWPLVTADLAARYTSSAAFNATNHALPTGPFSGTGIGLRPGTNGSLNVSTKTLTNTTSVRCVFAKWIKLTKTAYTANWDEMLFQINGTSGNHATLTFDPNTNTLTLRLGSAAGSVIHTAVYALADGNYHWVEWVWAGDDWQGESQIWVDGTEITGLRVARADIVKTSQTDASGAATYAINAQKRTVGEFTNVDFDDLVIYDFTSLWDNRAGITDMATNPLSKFTTVTAGVNFYILKKTTAKAGVTYDQLRFFVPTAAPTIKFCAFVYPDSAGSPNGLGLLASSAEVTGVTVGEQKINFTSAYTPVSDTVVWIGISYITAGLPIRYMAANETVRQFANGGSDTPAATCPATTTTSAAWAFWLANAATADAFAAPTLGKRWIRTYRPTSDSSVAWTKSTGASNFGCVDEAGYDITDYNSSATLNQEDLYGLADYDWTLPIYAVQLSALGVLASGTSASLKASMKSNATTVRTTTGVAMAALVAEAHIIQDTDPNGAITWAAAAVNALTGGMQLSATAGAGTVRVGQVFMEVLADGLINELLDQASIILTSFAVTDTVTLVEALDQASAILTSFPVTEVITINEALDAAGVALTSFDMEDFLIPPPPAAVQHVGRTDAPTLGKARGSGPFLQSVNRVLSPLRRGRVNNPKLGQ